MLSEALYKLRDFFKDNPEIALCFSGGVDSAFLLYFGRHCGARIKAYYVKTAFQPQSELNDAIRFANQIGTDLSVLKADLLSVSQVKENSDDRCYYCKRKLLSAIKNQAVKDGFTVLIDGTNASDEAEECSGKQALFEFSVYSPLKECGIEKAKVRMLSKKAGLFT